jgi:hypothetical protein
MDTQYRQMIHLPASLCGKRKGIKQDRTGKRSAATWFAGGERKEHPKAIIINKAV